MATYNGKNYLETQIESLISQEGVKVEIDVLDDGSTDGTYALLEELALKGHISSLRKASRIGSSAAFLQLLSSAKPANYYAFSDQDDIWEKSKLIKQVKRFEGASPKLIISNRSLINGNGEIIKRTHKSSPLPNWRNALVQNIAFGNTQVMNQSLVDIILQNPKAVKHYDAWVYLLASLYGSVVRIEEDLVQYRIHDKNSVGLGNRTRINVFAAIKEFRDQVRVASKNIHNISLDKQNEIGKYLRVFESRNFLSRMFYSIACEAKRTSSLETFVWKILAPIIANK